MPLVQLRDNILHLASECFAKPDIDVVCDSCMFFMETDRSVYFVTPVEKPLLQDNMDMLLAVLRMGFRDRDIRNVFLRSVFFNALKGFSPSMFMKAILPESISREALIERGEFVRLGFTEVLPAKTEHKAKNFTFSKLVLDYVPSAVSSCNDVLVLDSLIKSCHQLASAMDIAYLASYFRKPEWEQLGDDVWWELMACLVCPEVNSQHLFDFYLTNPNVPHCVVLNLKPGTYIVPQGGFTNRGIMGPAEEGAQEAVLMLTKPLVLHASCCLWNLRITADFPFADAEGGFVVRCEGRPQSEKHTAVIANVVLDRGGVLFQYLRSARLVNSIVQRTPVGVYAAHVTDIQVTRVNTNWGSCMSNFWECGIAFMAQNCMSVTFEKQVMKSCAVLFRVSDTLEFSVRNTIVQDVGMVGYAFVRNTVHMSYSQFMALDCALRIRQGGQMRQNYVVTQRRSAYPPDSLPLILPLQDKDQGAQDLGFTFAGDLQTANDVFAPDDVASWMRARKSAMVGQSPYAKRRPNPDGEPALACYHAVRHDMYASDFAGTPYERRPPQQDEVGQKRQAQGEPEDDDDMRELADLAGGQGELNHLLNV